MQEHNIIAKIFFVISEIRKKINYGKNRSVIAIH